MTAIPQITLNDGTTIPQLGFGVFQVPPPQAREVTAEALRAGYRSIDTAAIYRNEEGVGQAVAESGLPREELYLTTKVWNSEQGYDSTLRAFDKSLKRLGLDRLDLYLIHWPAPAQDRYVDTWKALLTLREEGRLTSAGVSNFQVPHLRRIAGETGVLPVLNQIELHPLLPQAELRAFHAEQGIATEAWSPLAQGALLDDEVIAKIAAQHGKTPAQVVLRWHLQLGNVVIPKSVTPSRIAANLEVFDFELSDDDLTQIATLDNSTRTGLHPDTFD
jgi:diketogulonate reductase-like aldo/keto reductase